MFKPIDTSNGRSIDFEKDPFLFEISEYDRLKYQNASNAERSKFRRHLRQKARRYRDTSKKRFRKVGLR